MADAELPYDSGVVPADATSRVLRLRSCRLQVATGPWPYAATQAAGIDRHWQRRSAENPALFNGVVHMLRAASIAHDNLDGAFVRTDFKSYLFWREQGFPQADARDAFGSALLLSREGHVLLGRQGGGHLNAGRIYLPGGFIDHRDVRTDDTIDIDASISRELREETGLAPADLQRRPGYIATFCGPLVSIGIEYRSPLAADALRDRILSHIAHDVKSELTDIVIVRSVGDLAGQAVVPYAARLLEWLFTETGTS